MISRTMTYRFDMKALILLLLAFPVYADRLDIHERINGDYVGITGKCLETALRKQGEFIHAGHYCDIYVVTSPKIRPPYDSHAVVYCADNQMIYNDGQGWPYRPVHINRFFERYEYVRVWR